MITTSAELEELIDSTVSIPTIPTVLTEITAILDSPDGSAKDAAAVIEKDPAIATRALRLVNSSFYGLKNPVSNINLGCSILGLQVIKNLVVQATVLQTFQSDEREVLDADWLWDHSFKAAVACRMLAERTEIAGDVGKDDAYTCGLIHDIGKLVIAQCVPPGALKLLGDAAEREQLAIHEAEKTVLGIDHAEIGGFVARTWGLPVSVQVALIQHHVPRSDDVFTHALILADRLSHAAMSFTEMTTPDTDEEEALAIAKGLVPDVRTHTAICGFDPIDLPATIIQVATETESILNEYA